MSDQTIAVGLVGPGSIGRTLLEQIAERAPALKAEHGIDLRLRCLCNSRHMLLPQQDLAWSSASAALAASSLPVDLDLLANHLRATHLPHTVLIDCTSSDELANRYPALLKAGIHVITPNKKAGAHDPARYAAIQEAIKLGKAQWFYEATVGAGLPVITTLRDLLRTGDRLLSIEGVFSGTLSFLFSRLAEGLPFSKALVEAVKLGYTEPDPRDDLSGEDVARKLVILAREAGHMLSLDQVDRLPLLPAALASRPTVESFMAGIASLDLHLEELRLRHAPQKGILRYVGIFEPGKGLKATLRTYPPEHPFAALRGGENIFAFTTDRYRTLPLIVRGPGAGPQVTAGGIFGDILRLAATLGGGR